MDVLVNNAGRSQRSEAIHTDIEVDQALMNLNFLSTVSLTKAVLPSMIEQGSGSLVIVSSVAGKIGKFFFYLDTLVMLAVSISIASPASASYAASKHALQVSQVNGDANCHLLFIQSS